MEGSVQGGTHLEEPLLHFATTTRVQALSESTCGSLLDGGGVCCGGREGVPGNLLGHRGSHPQGDSSPRNLLVPVLWGSGHH